MAYPSVPKTGSLPGSYGGGPLAAKPRTVTVKKHTRVIAPSQHHADAVARRDAKLHTNALARRNAAQAPASTTPSDQALLDAAVRLRFAPEEQAYGQQLAQNARFSSGTGDWYKQALGEIQALQSQGRAQSAQTLQGIQNYNSQPTLQNPTDVQAAQARNNLNTEFAAKFGQGADANSAFMDRLAAAQTIQEGNTRSASNVERQRLLAGRTALEGQKGDYRTTYGAQMQTAAQKAAMDAANLAVKQGTLAYLTGNAQSLAKDRTVNQGIARTKTRLAASDPSRQKTAADLAYFNKHGYYPPTGPPTANKPGGNRTEGQVNAHHKIIRQVTNAVDDVTRGLRDHKSSPSAIRGAMKLEKIPNDVIDAAFTLANGGALTAKQIARLKTAGLIAAPKAWKQGKPKPIKVSPVPPSPSQGLQGPGGI